MTGEEGPYAGRREVTEEEERFAGVVQWVFIPVIARSSEGKVRGATKQSLLAVFEIGGETGS
jgi:hypothetical protein